MYNRIYFARQAYFTMAVVYSKILKCFVQYVMCCLLKNYNRTASIHYSIDGFYTDS
jgi:hypothetical protein